MISLTKLVLGDKLAFVAGIAQSSLVLCEDSECTFIILLKICDGEGGLGDAVLRDFGPPRAVSVLGLQEVAQDWTAAVGIRCLP